VGRGRIGRILVCHEIVLGELYKIFFEKGLGNCVLTADCVTAFGYRVRREGVGDLYVDSPLC